MNRNDKWQNNKDYQRASDIDVTKTTKETIEAAAVAHFTLGDYDGFKLGMSALNKLQAKSEVSELKEMMAAILAKNADTVTKDQ